MKISNEEKELYFALTELSLALEEVDIDIEVYKNLSEKVTELEVAVTNFINSLDKK